MLTADVLKEVKTHEFRKNAFFKSENTKEMSTFLRKPLCQIKQTGKYYSDRYFFNRFLSFIMIVTAILCLLTRGFPRKFASLLLSS